MPREAHLQLVRAWMERVDEVGIFRAVDEIAVPDVRLENPGRVSDAEGLRLRFREVERAFPDAEASVYEVISEGNRLVLVLELRATHLGPLRNIEPTGRPVHFNVAFFLELEGNRVQRVRSYPELFAVLEQIGVFPSLNERGATMLEPGR